ncbi:MAG: Maf family protein [Candidatus Hodarchaeales archaeon]
MKENNRTRMSKLPKIILASKSPGRAKILDQIKIPYITIPSEVIEDKFSEDPRKYVQDLSLKKAKKVCTLIEKEEKFKHSVIIACDTVVMDPYGKIVGKPKLYEEAKTMLRTFSDKSHTVLTGCTVIIKPGYNIYQNVISTQVVFKRLFDEEINFYLDKERWELRAGGYAIQGLGALLIKEIKGDYYNVVGMPICWIWQTLIDHYNFDILKLIKKKVEE